MRDVGQDCAETDRQQQRRLIVVFDSQEDQERAYAPHDDVLPAQAEKAHEQLV